MIARVAINENAILAFQRFADRGDTMIVGDTPGTVQDSMREK